MDDDVVVGSVASKHVRHVEGRGMMILVVVVVGEAYEALKWF